MFNWNKKGARFAARFSKPLIGTSDCHSLKHFAYTYSLVDAKKDIKSIVNAVKQGKVKVVSSPLPLTLFVSLTMTSAIKTLFLGLKSFFKLKQKEKLPKPKKISRRQRKLVIKKVKARTLTKT